MKSPRGADREGVIVKSLAGLEAAAGMDMLCCDKTGTLTCNKMVIQVRTQCYFNSSALAVVVALVRVR